MHPAKLCHNGCVANQSRGVSGLMRKGKRGQKVIPSASRGALNPKDRLRQQAYGLRNTRNFAQAKPLLEELYKLEPDNLPLALDLGEAYMETEDFASATSLYAKLIEKDPKNINAVTNLGGSLIRQGKLSDARSILEYALQLDPKSIHARINLGSVLQASGERKANLDNALEAVQIDPSSSLAFNNLGSAFSDMAMFKEARHAYETAIMLDPNQVDALINLAAVEARLGDSKASAEMYERVLKLLPKEAEQRAEAVKFYAAFEYLKQGVLEKGWDYYEGGFSPLVPAKGARTPGRNFDVPRWDGQPLNGKTLLVWREQGLGDELLFATCLHELEALGGNIIVECDARLVTVFQRSFPQYTVRAETFMPNHGMKSPFSDFDLHLPMGSLMKYFRRNIKDFERSGAYIKPDPAKVAKFEKRLAPYKDDYRLVGICWRSGKLDPVRNLAYTTLDDMCRHLQLSNHKLINLQYGDCEAELLEIEEKYGLDVLRWKDLNLRNDLEDVFALIECLHFVVSVQTAVLTMSSSLGKLSFGIKAGGWPMLGNKESHPFFPAQVKVREMADIAGSVLRDLKEKSPALNSPDEECHRETSPISIYDFFANVLAPSETHRSKLDLRMSLVDDARKLRDDLLTPTGMRIINLNFEELYIKHPLVWSNIRNHLVLSNGELSSKKDYYEILLKLAIIGENLDDLITDKGAVEKITTDLVSAIDVRQTLRLLSAILEPEDLLDYAMERGVPSTSSALCELAEILFRKGYYRPSYDLFLLALERKELGHYYLPSLLMCGMKLVPNSQDYYENLTDLLDYDLPMLMQAQAQVILNDIARWGDKSQLVDRIEVLDDSLRGMNLLSARANVTLAKWIIRGGASTSNLEEFGGEMGYYLKFCDLIICSRASESERISTLVNEIKAYGQSSQNTGLIIWRDVVNGNWIDLRQNILNAYFLSNFRSANQPLISLYNLGLSSHTLIGRLSSHSNYLSSTPVPSDLIELDISTGRIGENWITLMFSQGREDVGA
jgi:tetratricopeptide (TPR) repeat protein